VGVEFLVGIYSFTVGGGDGPSGVNDLTYGRKGVDYGRFQNKFTSHQWL
jgi:hypothetical protein